VDFVDRKLGDLDARRKRAEAEITRLAQQVHEVDQKIRFYLADRQKNPHPRHLEFIDKVQRYRIDPAASNKHLETLLDNLQWKIFYYQKAWKQVWENAEAAYSQGRKVAMDTSAPSASAEEKEKEAPKAKSQYSLESLWAIQQVHGADANETKEEFKKRMIQEYNQLSGIRKPGQDIVMTYDADEKKCKLDLKDK